MPRRNFIFDAPDRFVAEAIGEPGHRTFYLQAAQGRRVVTVAIEKAQVAVLAERLSDLMAEVERRGVDLPKGTEGSSTDAMLTRGLDEPIIEAFRVGSMTLTWDGQREALVVEAHEVTDEDADEEDEEVTAQTDDETADGPDMLRVQLSPPAARRFIAHAAEVVAAGRPPCPFCGLPLNPEGHICPRKNGYMH